MDPVLAFATWRRVRRGAPRYILCACKKVQGRVVLFEKERMAPGVLTASLRSLYASCGVLDASELATHSPKAVGCAALRGPRPATRMDHGQGRLDGPGILPSVSIPVQPSRAALCFFSARAVVKRHLLVLLCLRASAAVSDAVQCIPTLSVARTARDGTTTAFRPPNSAVGLAAASKAASRPRPLSLRQPLKTLLPHPPPPPLPPPEPLSSPPRPL